MFVFLTERVIVSLSSLFIIPLMNDNESDKEMHDSLLLCLGNLGAATLARGGAKFSDAPPRYESWQDHAQPLSTTGPPPPSR